MSCFGVPLTPASFCLRGFVHCLYGPILVHWCHVSECIYILLRGFTHYLYGPPCALSSHFLCHFMLPHSFELDLTVRLVLWYRIFECMSILLLGFECKESGVFSFVRFVSVGATCSGRRSPFRKSRAVTCPFPFPFAFTLLFVFTKMASALSFDFSFFFVLQESYCVVLLFLFGAVHFPMEYVPHLCLSISMNILSFDLFVLIPFCENFSDFFYFSWRVLFASSPLYFVPN